MCDNAFHMPRILLKKLLGLLLVRYRIVRTKKRRLCVLRGPKRAYKANKEEARTLVHRKLVEWNLHYNFTYNKVAIRDQRSRWGSCSKKGNLNFNYRILLLPEHLQDYIIVHELCHIGMFNHSREFWALVAKTVPDHAVRRRALTAHAKQGFNIPLI